MSNARPRESRPRVRTRSEPTAPDMVAPSSEPAATEPSEPPAGDGLKRLSFYVHESTGEPAWDRMHDSVRARVQKIRGGAPGGGGAPSGMSAMVSKTLTAALVGSIPAIAQILARLTGHTAESSERVTLTDKQKAELMPLYEAAIADYGLTLGRHENLIIALGMTGLMLAPGVQQLERVKKPNGAAGGPLLTMMEKPEETSVTAESPH
jgi:hypothetical protein